MTSKKHRKKMREKRIELSFDDDVKNLLKDLSDELGVSQSQLAQFFILTGVKNVSAARSMLPRYLEPSNAPMWQHKINLERLKKDLGYK